MSKSISQFNTARLKAERIEAEHLAELAALHGDAQVMATLGGVRTLEASGEYLANCVQHWATYGFGLWMFYDAAGKFAGRGGIRHKMVDGIDEIEVAYALVPEFWGQGFATEIAQASIGIAKELKIPELVAFTLTTNASSRRVMEKVGFRFEKEFIYGGHTHVLYRLALR